MAWTYPRSTRLEGLRNPHSVTRISLTTPGPEPAAAVRDQTRSNCAGPGPYSYMDGRHHSQEQ
jgi:hypothetical protein